jgi:hypothetical protein
MPRGQHHQKFQIQQQTQPKVSIERSKACQNIQNPFKKLQFISRDRDLSIGYRRMEGKKIHRGPVEPYPFPFRPREADAARSDGPPFHPNYYATIPILCKENSARGLS